MKTTMLVDDQARERPLARVLHLRQRLVTILRARGVSEHDRVVLSGENTADLVLTIFALMEIGVSIGLMDRGLTEKEHAERIAQSGPRWFLSDHDRLGKVFDRAQVGWIPLSELVEAALSGPDHSDDAVFESDSAFERWAARRDGLIVWTSGSTGRPKCVVRSGASVLDNVRRTQERMRYTSSDVLMPLLPFTHQYGFSMLLLWWISSASLVIVPSRRVDRALEAIARHKVTVVDAVPASYGTLLRILDGRQQAPELDSVRMWCVGGEPLSEQLRKRFEARLGKPLLDGYGSSEAGNIALASPDAPVQCGPPLDGVTVEILREDGSPAPAGMLGEVVVRSPDIMVGVLEPGGDMRWVDRTVYHTDDVGLVDEYGNLQVLGRRAAIHRFGHTLYLDEIARRASACGVPVEVVAIEDDERGTQVVFVLADPEDRPAAYWRRTIRSLVAAHERPNRVVVLTEFPTNGSGKIDTRAIEEVAAAVVAMGGVKGMLPKKRTAPGNLRANNGTGIPFPSRRAGLEAVVDLLRERRREVIALLTEVCTYKTAYGEVDAAIATLQGASDEVAENTPPALEQVGVLMPSNIPLYSYVMYLLVPSLFSRRVVFRPSRRIGDTTHKLHELLAGVHGLPVVLDESDQRGFLEVEGARSDVLVFTGTYENAEIIRAQLRNDQLFLYFGQGVNPFIVGSDANIAKATDALMRVRLINSGQDCFGPDVVFVDTSISAKFCNLLCRRVDNLRYGTFDDPMADYSAMFYLDAFEKSLEHLRRNRDHIATGGEVDFVDAHLSPTVLIRPSDARVTPPELFAPIFNVVPFTSTEWLHKMLSHPYFEERAMAATVYGTMPETVEVLRRRHMVSENETILEIEDGNLPFGGRGIRANYAAIGKKRQACPLLMSRAVAKYLSGSEPQGDL